jgi:hypothetical protein
MNIWTWGGSSMFLDETFSLQELLQVGKLHDTHAGQNHHAKDAIPQHPGIGGL